MLSCNPAQQSASQPVNHGILGGSQHNPPNSMATRPPMWFPSQARESLFPLSSASKPVAFPHRLLVSLCFGFSFVDFCLTLNSNTLRHPERRESRARFVWADSLPVRNHSLIRCVWVQSPCRFPFWVYFPSLVIFLLSLWLFFFLSFSFFAPPPLSLGLGFPFLFSVLICVFLRLSCYSLGFVDC